VDDNEGDSVVEMVGGFDEYVVIEVKGVVVSTSEVDNFTNDSVTWPA